MSKIIATSGRPDSALAVIRIEDLRMGHDALLGRS